MLLLITYDIRTETPEGKRRLRHVAKRCQACGQRVQSSVFECIVDAAQGEMLKQQLLKIIDADVDSLRFYNLGNNHKARVEHFGAKPALDLEGVLMI